MAVTIQVFDLRDFEQVVTLSGIPYRLRIRWNDRMSTYTMDIKDTEDNPIVMGTRIVLNYPMALLTQGGPQGSFMCVDPSGLRNADPGIDAWKQYGYSVMYDDSQV